MLKTLIEKEIREILGSAKFAVTFGVCGLLIIISFYTGAKSYEVNRSRYEAAMTENSARLEGMTDWFNVGGNAIYLPPRPLAALVNGIDNDIGRTIHVEGRGELFAEGSRFNEDPLFAVFQFLDFGFVLVVILSLFAILLGYDAINGEKERGTLRLSFANAVPRHTYILGKLIGSFIALAAPLIAATAIGCLLLRLLDVPMSGDEWSRLMLITLAGLLYFGAFLTLSIMISAATERSANSFLFLLVTWIIAVLIIPRASVLVSARAIDVPTVDELAAEKATFSRQIWQEDRDKMGNFKPTANDDIDKLMDEFNKFMNEMADSRDERMKELAGRLNERRRNKQRQQEKLAFTLARISPATQVSLATAALAGTSLELKDRFVEQAEEYQSQYSAFMKEKTGFNPGGRMITIRQMSDDDEKPEPINPQEMPAFAFRPVRPVEAFNSAVVDMGLLALLNVVFFAGAFVAFSRYDVR